jgi:pantoate--beta-alanine ligase
VIVAKTRAELRAALHDPRPVVLVPTMGALHRGHAALLSHATSLGAQVVTSIFVNPLQFGPGEDLDRYPRTTESDVAMCAAAGVDVVFAPEVATMYPNGAPLVTIEPGPVASILEGKSRPMHFRGVLTVVAKLLGFVQPDVVVFGEKDYQQLVLVRQMVSDLSMATDVHRVETVRDDDGLALSSRNRFLSGPERNRALGLSRALRAGHAAGHEGAASVVAAGRAVLDAIPGLAVDYLSLRATDLSEPPTTGEARLLVAAKLGSTRLIDNAAVTLGRPDAPEAR